jgi:hypothetical protein
MIRMGKVSELEASEVVEKAVAFFGSAGWGLETVEEAACCARFTGGGGYVFVQASDGKEAGTSDVEVEGREWEKQIRAFIGEI